MTQEDAAAFINALNNIAPYVPPMHMQPLINSPVSKYILQVANNPPIQSGTLNGKEEKPHMVS